MKGWEWFFKVTRPMWVRLVGVVIMTALGFFLSYLTREDAHFFATMVVSGMLMPLYGGFWLGLIFTAIMGLAIDYYFIWPVGSVLSSWEELMEFPVLMVVVTAIGLLTSSLREAFQKIDQAKSDLEQAIQARDEIIGIVSHEIKNPLMALQLGIKLIERLLPKRADTHGVMVQIARLEPLIKKMALLVEDLLDVTRLEAKVMSLDLKTSDLEEIIREVLESHHAVAVQKGIRLESHLAPKAAQVYCDPARCNQILSNLVGNSLKFTEPGGFVRVSTVNQGEMIEVTVTDSGKGIAPQHLPHVFDRFWQSDNRLREHGTGLGLAIAKGLVEAHGGRIWVDSEIGKGSVFRFTLRSAAEVSKLTSIHSSAA